MFRFGAFCGGLGWSWLLPRPQKSSRAAKLADLERMVLKKSLGKGNMNQKDYKRIVFLDQKTN